MWTSARTRLTVRTATVWTPQGPTIASAPPPGPWPPTATAASPLRSRPVSGATPPGSDVSEGQEVELSEGRREGIVDLGFNEYSCVLNPCFVA